MYHVPSNTTQVIVKYEYPVFSQMEVVSCTERPLPTVSAEIIKSGADSGLSAVSYLSTSLPLASAVARAYAAPFLYDDLGKSSLKLDVNTWVATNALVTDGRFLNFCCQGFFRSKCAVRTCMHNKTIWKLAFPQKFGPVLAVNELVQRRLVQTIPET